LNTKQVATLPIYDDLEMFKHVPLFPITYTEGKVTLWMTYHNRVLHGACLNVSPTGDALPGGGHALHVAGIDVDPVDMEEPRRRVHFLDDGVLVHDIFYKFKFKNAIGVTYRREFSDLDIITTTSKKRPRDVDNDSDSQPELKKMRLQ
jgi:hypothetical protein